MSAIPVPAYDASTWAGWAPTEILVVRYATRPTAHRAEHFYEHVDRSQETMPIDYFVWLVRGPGRSILVDAGFTPSTAEARPGRHHLGSPLEALHDVGVESGEITDVVVTHCHYDHTGYVAALPDARVHLQAEELRFWTGPAAHHELYRTIIERADLLNLVERNLDGSLVQHEGALTLAPGVSLHPVGGHTAGMQVVRVELATAVVVLASDASHFYENVGHRRPYAIAHCVPDVLAAFDTVEQLARGANGTAGVVLPGHDPAVCVRFPPVRPDLAGRVHVIR